MRFLPEHHLAFMDHGCLFIIDVGYPFHVAYLTLYLLKHLVELKNTCKAEWSYVQP